MKDGAAVLCWKLPDGAQSFDFCSQIVTELINATFLLVDKIENDRNGIERCAPSNLRSGSPTGFLTILLY